MLERPLIVNATAIGNRADGIAAYGVNLVQALWRAGVERPVTFVLNEDARRFFPESEMPEGASMLWVSPRISPSRGTPGNLRRWCFANQLARRHREALVFGLSQLEAPLVSGCGIVMVHDMIPLLFPDEHPRQSYFYRHCLGRALQRARAVVTPSQTTKDDVCRHYGLPGHHVHVIHHGSPVPIAWHERSDRRRDPYILWIGRPDPTKNLSALLEAFQVIERHLDVRLVIAGGGVPVDVGAHGVQGKSVRRVTVLGSVSETDKIALLDRAAVLVAPSLYEGFGFTALEAMARGCPVVAARAGALPEVCADAALFVDPREPGQIARALRRVLTSPDLARDLAARGRARAGELTWAASVRAHLALFDLVARADSASQSEPSRRRQRIEAEALR